MVEPAWKGAVDEEIERFRALPRPAGRGFLGPDGRLSQDEVERYFEGQAEPERTAKPAWERKLKV